MARYLPVEITGDQVTYRAGALGGCLKSLVACRQEFMVIDRVPEALEKRFQQGIEAEQMALAKMGLDWHIAQRQREVTLTVSERIKVIGHLDAGFAQLREGDSYPLMVEVKSHTSEEFRKPLRQHALWERWAWQISTYMEASGRSCLVVRYCIDTGEMQSEVLTEPPHNAQEIRARVLLIEHLATKDIGDVECSLMFPCPVFYLHDVIEEDYEDLTDDLLLNDLANEYKTAGTEKTAVEGRRTGARDAILKVLKGRTKVQTKDWRIRVTTVETKERVVPAGKYERVSVTPNKEKDGE
jgi:hypothetical protein